MWFSKFCAGAFLLLMSLTSFRVGTGQMPFMGSSGAAQTTAAADETPYSGEAVQGQEIYEERAEDLRSMDLVVPEVMVQELSEYLGDAAGKEYMEDSLELDPAFVYREILLYLGYEHFGEEFYGTPSIYQVYAFDYEVWDISSMYTDVLYGIISISDGAFTITDIEESTDQVDYENNEGVQILSFQYNGVPYTFEGEVNHDWLDVSFLDFMNQVFEEQGNPNRLLITGDGGQGCILLYNTPEWGAQLDAMTGLGIYGY